MSSNSPRLFIVSAPSGSGKTTLCNMLLQKYGNEIYFSVSCTTREKRQGEREGVDYFFLDEGSFKKMIENNEFAEWANVYGFYYGTPKPRIDEALNQGKNVLLDIDVQGAAKIKKVYPDAVSIFIMPPSIEELRRRLTKRATDPDEIIEHRLTIAKKEMAGADKYDYVIVNDELDKAFARLEKIYRGTL